MNTITQADLVAELRQRFGDNPSAWAFQCPSCKDIATAAEFTAALTEQPRTNRDGSQTTASDIIGQECIGRTLGALQMRSNAEWKGRGCDWCAYGLIGGPLGIVMPNGRVVRSFNIAPAAESVTA